MRGSSFILLREFGNTSKIGMICCIQIGYVSAMKHRLSFTKLYIKGVRRLHFLVLLALCVPFFCRIASLGSDDPAVSRAQEAFIPLYALTLTIILPAVLIYLLQEKASSLGIFLLCTCPLAILYLAALFALEKSLGFSVNGSERIPQALIMLSFLLDAIRMRTNDNSRKKAKDDNDISWTGDQYLLPLPALQYLLMFAFFYIAALLFHSHELAFVSLFGAILYFFLVFPYLMMLRKEQYLENRKNVQRIPTELIARLQGTSLIRALIPCALFAAAALLTSSGRRFLNLPRIVLEGTGSYSFGPLMPGCKMMRKWLPIDLGNRGGPPPQWVMDLFEFIDNVVAILILALAAYAFYRGIRGIVIRFRYHGSPEIRAASSRHTVDEHVSLKKERPGFSFRRPVNAVRRKYMKTILHYRKEAPDISETPAKMELLAGLPDTLQMRTLHEDYESVRYGRGQ